MEKPHTLTGRMKKFGRRLLNAAVISLLTITLSQPGLPAQEPAPTPIENLTPSAPAPVIDAARSKAINPKTPQPSTGRAPQMIANARGTVATGRDRRGITHGLGTYEFKTTPMARRIAGSTGPTQMMGTKGIGVERYSNGITRAAKTNVLGYSSHVRAPHLNGPNGLSTLHTTGRAWSSFHPNGSSR